MCVLLLSAKKQELVWFCEVFKSGQIQNAHRRGLCAFCSCLQRNKNWFGFEVFSRRNACYVQYEKDRDGSLEKGKMAPRKIQLTLSKNQSQIFHHDMVLQDTYHMRRHAGKTESRSVPGTRILATAHIYIYTQTGLRAVGNFLK